MIDLGNFGLVATFFLAVGALWVALSRFNVRVDNSWPLIFYFCLIAWANTYAERFNPITMYSSALCGLLLRFEFMPERMVMFIRFVELALLIVIAWDLFQILLSAV
jgi:uncharacterized membrane protein YoaK (UPF0700 family)